MFPIVVFLQAKIICFLAILPESRLEWLFDAVARF